MMYYFWWKIINSSIRFNVIPYIDSKRTFQKFFTDFPSFSFLFSAFRFPVSRFTEGRNLLCLRQLFLFLGSFYGLTTSGVGTSGMMQAFAICNGLAADTARLRLPGSGRARQRAMVSTWRDRWRRVYISNGVQISKATAWSDWRRCGAWRYWWRRFFFSRRVSINGKCQIMDIAVFFCFFFYFSLMAGYSFLFYEIKCLNQLSFKRKKKVGEKIGFWDNYIKRISMY